MAKTGTLRRLLGGFPTSSGRDAARSWTAEFLRRNISSGRKPTALRGNVGLRSLADSPVTPLVCEVASIMGTGVPADQREKVVNAVVGKLRRRDGDIAIAASLRLAEAAVRAMTTDDESVLAACLIATAAIVIALSCLETTGYVPLVAREGVVGVSLPGDRPVDEVLGLAQWAIHHNYSIGPMARSAEVVALTLGEAERPDEAAEIKLLPETGIGYQLGLALTGTRPHGPNPPQALLNAMHTCIGISVREDQERYAGLPEVPDPTSARKDILEHAQYALWPGVTEVYWREGCLRRLRLLPLSSGNVETVIETEGPSGETLLSMREVPAFSGPRSDLEWEALKQNHQEELRLGYIDPICHAIEAVRMCLVPKERKVLDGHPHRIPTGLVSAARKPRRTDTAIRYIRSFLHDYT